MNEWTAVNMAFTVNSLEDEDVEVTVNGLHWVALKLPELALYLVREMGVTMEGAHVAKLKYRGVNGTRCIVEVKPGHQCYAPTYPPFDKCHMHRNGRFPTHEKNKVYLESGLQFKVLNLHELVPQVEQ